MGFLYAFAAVAIALVVWRVVTPADARLNRRYISRFLKDRNGEGPKRLRVERIPMLTPAGKPEERVFFHVEAQFPDGTIEQVTAQVFYPLEALQMERDKKKKALATDDYNMMQNPASLGGQQTPQEEAERFKEDPLKELTEEHKTVERKTAQLDAEVEQLKLINRCTTLFPQLIAYDRSQHITLMGPVGVTRLDTMLQKGKVPERLALLKTLLSSMVEFHNAGEGLAARLLPAMSHNENLIKGQIAGSFEGYVLAGVSLTETDIMSAVDATSLIWSAGNALYGPKLADGSPRAFCVLDGKVRPVDFSKVRRDITLLDVVEILCDPATGLTPEQELELMKYYVETRFASGEASAGHLRDIIHLAIYYRMVLAGYLVKHFIALGKSSGEQRMALEIPYWNQGAIDRNVDALKYYLEHAPELAELRTLLVPKLDALRGHRVREQ